jgi:hypothetical protein
MAIRAKLRCYSVENFGPTAARSYKFNAATDKAGIPEDQQFTKYTPSASLTIAVDNANVVFVPGKEYFVDFTPVDEPVSKE